MKLRNLYAYEGAPAPVVTTDDVVRAVHVVAGHAEGPADLIHLLDVLGVADHGGTT